jgi:phosphinothricin acetyltransferase
LQAVIEASEKTGLRQLIAVIGDSANAGSIGLHAALGFEPAGILPGVGYKQGQWRDVVLMVKALNGGGVGAPDAPGLDLRLRHTG